jgi:hypothetical protein
MNRRDGQVDYNVNFWILEHFLDSRGSDTMFSGFCPRPVHINIRAGHDFKNLEIGAALKILVADITATNEADFIRFQA